MKAIIETIKIIVALSAVFWGIACFLGGIFCLYGGPDGVAFSANALVWAAIAVGIAAIMALLVLALYRFDKRLVLTLLILHEIILLLFFALMVVAITVQRDLPQLMAHPTPIVLAALIAGGYGICKTVKAIKAESKDV
jgi:hypothetical protein